MRTTLIWLPLVFSLTIFLMAGCQNEMAKPAGGESAADSQAAPPAADSASTTENAVSAAGGGRNVTREALSHRKFTLVQVNGVSYAGTMAAPTLEFGDSFQVSGRICNVFRGLGQLENDRLTVTAMVSTRMACLDESLGRLETRILELLANGAGISLDGPALFLKQGETSLRYEADVQD